MKTPATLHIAWTHGPTVKGPKLLPEFILMGNSNNINKSVTEMYTVSFCFIVETWVVMGTQVLQHEYGQFTVLLKTTSENY